MNPPKMKNEPDPHETTNWILDGMTPMDSKPPSNPQNGNTSPVAVTHPKHNKNDRFLYEGLNGVVYSFCFQTSFLLNHRIRLSLLLSGRFGSISGTPCTSTVSADESVS